MQIVTFDLLMFRHMVTQSRKYPILCRLAKGQLGQMNVCTWKYHSKPPTKLMECTRLKWDYDIALNAVMPMLIRYTSA